MDRDRPTGGTEPPPPGPLVTSVSCPSCGVTVAVGYPRCPKCHVPVPQPPRSRRTTAREELIAGGTSVAPPSGGYGGLLAIAALVAVGIIVMIVMVSRDDRGAAGPATEPAEATSPGDGPAGNPAGSDDDTVAPEPARPAPTDPTLRDALRALDIALREARVWSKVGVEGSVVVVESALCSDPAMPPILNEHLALLRSGGATAVRCQEPHGGVVFESDL